MMPPQEKPKQTVTPDSYKKIEAHSKTSAEQDRIEAEKIARAMGWKPATDVVKEATERGFKGGALDKEPKPQMRTYERALVRGVKMERGDLSGAFGYLSNTLQTRVMERELARRNLRRATQTNRRGSVATRGRASDTNRRGALATKAIGALGALARGALRPLAGAPRATRTGERARSQVSITLNRTAQRARLDAARARAAAARTAARARVRATKEKARAQVKAAREKAKLATQKARAAAKEKVARTQAAQRAKVAKQKAAKAAKKAAHNKKLHDKKVLEQQKKYNPLWQLMKSQKIPKLKGPRLRKLDRKLGAMQPGLTTINAKGVAFPKTATQSKKKDCECKKPEKRPICKNPIVKIVRDLETMTITRKMTCPRFKSKRPSVPVLQTPTSSQEAPSKSLVDVAQSLLG